MCAAFLSRSPLCVCVCVCVCVWASLLSLRCILCREVRLYVSSVLSIDPIRERERKTGTEAHMGCDRESVSPAPVAAARTRLRGLSRRLTGAGRRGPTWATAYSPSRRSWAAAAAAAAAAAVVVVHARSR